MKVTGPSATTAAGQARAASRAPAPGFALPAASAGSAGGVRAAGPVASLEALVAMQSVEGPLERRRKAVRRADRLLDILGEVKIGLIDGAMPASALERLTRAVREERATVDEPALSELLDEIETRAMVELAKLGVAT